MEAPNLSDQHSHKVTIRNQFFKEGLSEMPEMLTEAEITESV